MSKDFKIYSHKPFRYEVMKNVKIFRRDKLCFQNVLKYLGIECNAEGVRVDQIKEMTKYELYDIIKEKRPDVYIVGEMLKPYNTKTFKHQLLCLSNHVYISYTHKPLLSTHYEMSEKALNAKNTIKEDNLAKLYNDTLNN